MKKDAPDLDEVLNKVRETAQCIAQKDEINRDKLMQLGEELHESAKMSRVYAETQNFDLELGPYESVWEWGHLWVSENGWGMAVRNVIDDAPPFDPSWRTIRVQDWPVDWVRIAVSKDAMSQLAESLHDAQLAYLEGDTAHQDLPLQLVRPEPHVVETANRLSWPTVIEEWQNLQRLSPSAAVRGACSLIETVCKHVLAHLKVEEPRDNKVTSLVKVVFLAFDKIGLASSSDQLLGNVKGVVAGIAQVRNEKSDAHGNGPLDGTITRTESSLVVDVSGAVAVFIMSRLQDAEELRNG